MNIQAKVALQKQEHPERYCKEPRCLWRVVQLDHATQTFSPRPDCPGGRCPRHRLHRKRIGDFKMSVVVIADRAVPS